MDKDTLIYIVLGIAWAIISGMGKKKQKKGAPKRPTPQSEQGREEMTLEDMISALRGEGKPKVEKQPEPVYESNVNIEEHTVEEYTFQSQRKKTTEKPRHKSLEVIEPVRHKDHRALDAEDYDDGIDFSFAEDVLEEKKSIKFNAREAMIYDVIMNRPKY